MKTLRRIFGEEDEFTTICSEIDCIVTRNVKHYAKSFVKVCEPSVLIKVIRGRKRTE